MRRGRLLPGVVCGAGVATLLGPAPAGAEDGTQRITVTPSAGLVDGQVVQVDGSGWPDPRFDFQSWGLAQCRGTTVDYATCGNLQGIPESEITASGSFSVDYAVRRSLPSQDGDATIDCGRSQCHVVAVMIVNTPSRPGRLEASSPISFRAPK